MRAARPHPSDDLYADLGVDSQVTSTALRARWRTLAKEHHPDTGGDRATFERLQQAYATIADPRTRAQYDSTRVTPTRGTQPVRQPQTVRTPATPVRQDRPASKPVTATVRRTLPERAWVSALSMRLATLGGLLAGGVHGVALLLGILGLRGTLPVTIDEGALWGTYTRLVAVTAAAGWLFAAAIIEQLHRRSSMSRTAIVVLATAGTAVAATWTNPLVLSVAAVYIMTRRTTARSAA